jgi:hypothetical protein
MKKFTYQIIAFLSISFLLSGCGTSTSTSGVFSLAHTYLIRDDGNGGKIFSSSDFGNYSDVTTVASQYCQERRLGKAEITRQTLNAPSVKHYEFKCMSITYAQPTPVTPSNNISMDVAKQKCGELGFKSGTEGFGKCVLQLSK